MAIDLLANPIMYIFDGLTRFILPNGTLIGISVLVFGIMACLANGIELGKSMIFLSPLLIGLVAQNYMPTLVWILIILLSTILWTLVSLKIVNLARR
jgi:hypothetical protein